VFISWPLHVATVLQCNLNGLIKAGAKSCFFVVACLFLCCVVPVVTNGENVRNDGETQTPYICTRLYWDFVRKIKKAFRVSLFVPFVFISCFSTGKFKTFSLSRMFYFVIR
jgi:hypothetical protein